MPSYSNTGSPVVRLRLSSRLQRQFQGPVSAGISPLFPSRVRQKKMLTLSHRSKILALRTYLGKRYSMVEAIQTGGANGALTDDQFEQQTGEWATHTQQVISAAYGDGEAALFLSDAGFMAGTVGGPHNSEKARNVLLSSFSPLGSHLCAHRSIRYSTLRWDFDPAKFAG